MTTSTFVCTTAQRHRTIRSGRRHCLSICRWDRKWRLPQSNSGVDGAWQMRMMNEFEAQVLSDLCVLKAQMTGLMGDGNGGRLAALERRMERHEQNWQRAKGFLAAVDRKS